MAFFVAHMQKHSQGGIKSHNERDLKNHSNLNIDPSKTKLNVELVESRNSKDSYESQYNQLIKDKYNNRKKSGELKKIRADQVKFNSFVFSASPEFFENQSIENQIKYFEDCKKYMETKIEPDNIISAKVHMDELTPHMHLIVVPLTKDGRLSSKELFNRNFLRDLQDECPKFLQNNSHNVQRGIDAQGINKRVSDLEYKKEMAQKLNEELEISEAHLESSSYYHKFQNDVLENRKSKINLFTEPTYKLTKEEFESVTKKAIMIDGYKKENEQLKRRLKKIEFKRGEISKIKQDANKIERENKLLSKFQKVVKEIVPKEVLQVVEKEMQELKNPWQKKINRDKNKQNGLKR